MNNYPTKYAMGERVRIASGLFAGRAGKVTDYMPQVTLGQIEDHAMRGLKYKSGTYTVKISWLLSVKCLEEQLVGENL